MSRLGGWLKKGASSANLPAINELEAMQHAMRGTVMIMNDEYAEAEAVLLQQDTPFHKLGLGCVCFLKAILGMQKEDIERGVKVLADAEHTNGEYQKRALANPASVHQSNVYPPGTMYALAHAESQLMYAVCAVLNASYIESIKGLLKMRKAYATLKEIVDHEHKYLRSIGIEPQPHRASSIRPSSRGSSARAAPSIISNGNAAPINGAAASKPHDDDDDDFQDAEEDLSGSPVSHRYQGHLKMPSVANIDLNAVNGVNGLHYANGVNGHATAPAPDVEETWEEAFDFRTVTNDPMDLFIHAGVGLAYGTMQLVLSMVPPPFDKVLSLFSFRGDRKTGLDLLWGSTIFIDDINGALASLITLVFHNGPIAFNQIIPKSALPVTRLQKLLVELRRLYPRSQIWQIEEAIMLSEARQLQPAIKVFNQGTVSPLQSIRALGKFEIGLHYLYAHEYEKCAQAFLDLRELSDWSFGLYYYIAAICYVEMYRTALSDGSGKAAEYKQQALSYFEEVYPNLGKKKVLGQGLPIEIFVKRKLDKYNGRASARKISLVDAIGVSPAEDIIYFWGGYDCMPDYDLRVSIERLAWSENQSGWTTESLDEKTVLSLLKGTCLRVMGQYEKAREELATGVTSHTPKTVQAGSGKDADMWALATAHYEIAVCYWREAGGETGDKATLQLAADEISKLSHWGHFELESIHGLKISTAAHTLRDLGCHV